MKIGMNRDTGKTISGEDHIRQSINDILTTPLGTRIMRRSYGSDLPNLIDHPANPATRALMIAATAKAIGRWEPRITLKKVAISKNTNGGKLTIDLYGYRNDLPNRPIFNPQITI